MIIESLLRHTYADVTQSLPYRDDQSCASAYNNIMSDSFSRQRVFLFQHVSSLDDSSLCLTHKAKTVTVDFDGVFTKRKKHLVVFPFVCERANNLFTTTRHGTTSLLSHRVIFSELHSSLLLSTYNQLCMFRKKTIFPSTKANFTYMPKKKFHVRILHYLDTYSSYLSNQ